MGGRGTGCLTLLTLGFDRLRTGIVLLGRKAGWQSFPSPIRLTQDFRSCTMNHVNCPQGITIFTQLLDNFLLLWHFPVFLLIVLAAHTNTTPTDTPRVFFLSLLFFILCSPQHPRCYYPFRRCKNQSKIFSDSKCKRLGVPWVSRNNKPGSGISFILIREHNYERQSSLIKMGDEIIVICLIILILTGEFIL